MGVVMFYHLTRSGPEQALRPLMERALGQGWRIMIRTPSREQRARLDERLWLHPEQSFLPHGLEGSEYDRDQPVLIGEGDAKNGAKGVILLDGAETSVEEAGSMERVWILFDGEDPAQLSKARADWKRLTEAGLSAQYWSEESGKWEKKAEKG